MAITAVIPVRAGSTRLKDKNISRFAGLNLLTWKIEQLKLVKEIENIVVSSDSDLMLEMAMDKGCQIQKRPPEFCDEITKPFGDVVEWVVSNVTGEHILWATVTSPLTDQTHYAAAIDKYYEVLGEYDSLVSFSVIKHFIWNEDGPVNYSLSSHVSSQNLPAFYQKTCGISIAPRGDMLRWKYDHGTNPYKYIIDKRAAVDIDDIYDLTCARAWLDVEWSY